MVDRVAPDKTPRFIGPPGRLRLVGVEGERLESLQGVVLPEQLAAGPRAPLRRGRHGARTRLRLPPETPPGEYTVSLSFAGGKQSQAKVSVQPRSRLRFTPSALRLAAPPGTTVKASLLIENRGNVAIDIDDVLITGLFDDDGIEAALASIYRLDTTDVSEIVGHGFARLREAHGGLLKLRVVAGAGTLEPGDQRVLELETRLAEKLQPKHGYHGVLELGEHGIAVELRVHAAPQPATGGTR